MTDDAQLSAPIEIERNGLCAMLMLMATSRRTGSGSV